MFPEIDISPLVSVIVYDIKGVKVFELKGIEVSEDEEKEIYKHFHHPIELIEWVHRYAEITLFRGRFRATFVKILNGTLLFISRIENVSSEFRPAIQKYVEALGIAIIDELATDADIQILPVLCGATIIRDEIKQEIQRIFDHFQIKRPVKPTKPAVSKTEMLLRKSEEFEKLQPFETVPQITYKNMTKELLNEALKKAAMSLLLSAIKDCKHQAASAYIFPKPDGTIGQLYAGDMGEKKIVYVLETLTKYIRVVYEMLKSKEEIKVLNAEIVQIIVEDVYNGRFLVGMTTHTDDIMSVAYRLKLIKHVITNIGL